MVVNPLRSASQRLASKLTSCFTRQSYHDTLVDIMKEAFPEMDDVLQPLNKGGNNSSHAVPLSQAIGQAPVPGPESQPALGSRSEMGEMKQEHHHP
jgi:cobalamin biosynthesis Co2+ chelatase CbiK